MSFTCEVVEVGVETSFSGAPPHMTFESYIPGTANRNEVRVPLKKGIEALLGGLVVLAQLKAHQAELVKSPDFEQVRNLLNELRERFPNS